MRDYILMTDSCCDMDPKLAEELELTVLPLTLDMGGQSFRNYLDGRELDFKDFYRRVRGGELATTSAISVGDFEAAMRPILESGRDIFAVPGSIFSPLSEGANHLLQEGARPVLRAEDLLEEYGMAPQGEAEQEPQCPAQAEQELPLSDAAKQMRAALTVHPQEFGALCAATGLAAGAAVEPEEQAGQKHHHHGQRRREGPIAAL